MWPTVEKINNQHYRVSSMELTARVRLAKDVLIQNIEGESILLNLATENYFVLDQVGTSIVTTLDESDSVAAATQKLLEIYEVEEGKLKEDISRLVNECEQAGLLQVTSR
jgi:hypothetical protein